MKTKTQRILEYIRDNQPCKAFKICEGAGLIRRTMKPLFSPSTKAYSYYVGWSGFRVNLTAGWDWSQDPSKASIKLTKAGYVLTDYGRTKLSKY